MPQIPMTIHRSFFSSLSILTAALLLHFTPSAQAVEIEISGNGYEIVDGDVTPWANDHTYFGVQTVGEGSITRTFTIRNIYSAFSFTNLQLTGSPRVAITGASSANFSVTQWPATPLSWQGASTTFQVTWTPTYGGTHNATITIPNNDSNENPYNFVIQAVAQLKLTYIAGSNGSLTGTPVQRVDYGTNGTPVTAVSATGYHFVNWSDGSTANPRNHTNVTANQTVTANFAINTYELNYTEGSNGSITGPTPQTIDHGSDGSAVTAVPAIGYYFVDWSDGSTANPRTDTNVTADISVTANFAINTYSLDYADDGNGSITGSTPQTIDHGSDGSEVTAVPATGYHFLDWSDGSTANPRTDTNVTADINVIANFAINTYTLNYADDGNGSITGSTTQTIDYGSDGSAVTAVPATGYHFVDWSDGSTTNPRTDTNVTAGLSLTANFAIYTYELQYTEGSNGSITGDTAQTIDYGSNGTTVTAEPATGYHFVEWSDGSTVNPRTDTNVTADLSVTANFAINTYSLNYSDDGNGSITGSTTQTIDHGSDGTAVTAVPNTGYYFVDWSDGSTTNPRTDTNVTAGLSFTANFAIYTYELQYTEGSNGSITGPTAQTIDHGSDGTEVTAVPATGYHFVDWSDGSTANPRTDTNITADLSVTANFAINTYTLNYADDGNGSITGTTTQTIDHRSNATTVTAVPNTGFYFVDWSDGSNANPRTDTNITADLSVTANFAIFTYTLNYADDGNGSITGITPQTIDYGSNGTTVTAVPATGYHFVDWSDGSTVNPRTDTNVTADLSVTANFAINTYSLNYADDGNGSITGTTPQTIDHGSDATTVTAVPNTGFHFVDWSDGSTANPRTDTNVSSDLSVTANFDFAPVSYTTGNEIPLTTDGFTATGLTVNFSLNFAPAPGTRLMVVNNTATSFITGRFSNLANGAEAQLSYNGVTYNFVAWYFGGDGNDLVLLWRDTGIVAWGQNANGQLGNDSTTDSTVPVHVSRSGILAGKTIVQVASGGSHNLALCSDGTIAAWGSNSHGQLGNNSTSDRKLPVEVTKTDTPLNNKTVIGIAAGESHSLAFCSDGTLVAWGANDDGQLGNDSSNSYSPVPVAVKKADTPLSGKKVIAIAAGGSHNLALCDDRSLVAWGLNSSGQLGNNTTTSSQVPVAVNSTDGVSALFGKTTVAITAGRFHNLAHFSDGSFAAWGANTSGQLGDGTTTDRKVPVLIDTAGTPLAGKTITTLATGEFHSMALCSDGTLAAWGLNLDGQLGDESTTQRNVPVAVHQTGALTGKTVVGIAAGAKHSLAQCSDGSLVAWGANDVGQLGDNTNLGGNGPVAVTQNGVLTGKTVLNIATGGSHCMALYAASRAFTVEHPLEVNLSPDASSTDCGTPTVGETTERTFTVRNDGIINLTGLSLTFSGTHMDDFSVAVSPASSLEPDMSTTFTIGFTPFGAGTRTATLRLASDESDVLPFDIALSGTGGYSEIVVEQPSGTALSSGSDSIDFGTPTSVGVHNTRTFTVRNTGDGDLTGLNITFSGTNPENFGVSLNPAPVVAPGTSTTFIVNFSAADPAAKSAILHLASNDTDQTPFDIALTGTGPASTNVSANYTNGTEVPLTATTGFTATGITLNFSLNFAPTPGSQLMVVDNTTPYFIDGTFDSLANGAEVNLSFGGTTYNFVAWYYGGDGNDLVLLWRDTGLASWAWNNAGQLGNNSTNPRGLPGRVDQAGVLAGKTIIAIATGRNHSTALCSDGTLAAWGDNFFGQLGNGSSDTNSLVPVAVDQSGVLAGKTVIAIAAGEFHSLALCSDGTLAAWGDNNLGQLGNNSSAPKSNVPVAVSQSGVLAGKSVIAIAAGGSHNLALCSDNSLVTWGLNSSGQLGNNTTTSSQVPVAVNSTDGVSALFGKTTVAITAGRFHNLAHFSDGSFAAWGANTSGQLGDGTTTDRKVPVLIDTAGTPLAGKTITTLATGEFHSAALCSDGTLAAWGINIYGQLGDGSTTQPNAPVAVNQTGALSAKTVIALAAGYNHNIVLCADGTIAAWGDNNFSQLGEVRVLFSATPVAMPSSGANFGSLAAGANHNMGIYAAPALPDLDVQHPYAVSLTSGSATIDFGPSIPAGSDTEQMLTLRNNGLGDLTGVNLSISGTHADNFSITNSLPTEIAAGLTSYIFVQFAPSSEGAKTAILHITSNDPNVSSFDINLSGTGTQSVLDTWRQTFYGASATNAGDAADSADPYNTGISNLLVFGFFGPSKDPATAQISQLPQATTTGGSLTYQFTEPSGVSGITYGAEWSATLQEGDWQPVTDTGTTYDGTHIFSVPIDGERKFLRLIINRTTP